MNRFVLGAAALLIGAANVAACASDEDAETVEGTGGTPTAGGQGGATAATGGAGGSATGGVAGTEEPGGAANQGGSDDAGGAANQGGAADAGGAANQGGAADAGGAANEGGRTVQGGAGGAGPETGNVCEDNDDCVDGATCYEGVCVASGSGIRVSLTWTAMADLDLYITTPDGVEISWEEPTGGGGYLDVDDCAYSSSDYDCADSTGTHVENVYFASPASGEYTLAVFGYETGGPSVDFTVTAFVDDAEVDSWTGTVATDDELEYSLTYAP